MRHLLFMKKINQYLTIGTLLTVSAAYADVTISEDTTWSSGRTLTQDEVLTINADKTLTTEGGNLDAQLGKIEMETGASIRVNNHFIYAGSKGYGVANGSSFSTLTALSNNALIEDNRLSHLYLKDTKIYLNLKEDLILQDVTLDNVAWDRSPDAIESTIATDNLTYNVSTGRGLTSISTVDNVISYTLNELSGHFYMSVSGDLTLNIDLSTDEQNALDAHFAAGGEAEVNLNNLSNATTLGLDEDMLNSLNINLGTYHMSYTHNDLTISGGSLSARIIPEPSTATLSLIALAGLMMRRRRGSGI